jgi:hypothetical protein
MTLTYTLSREALKQGAALHYVHRLGKWRFVRMILGMTALGAGTYLLTADYSRFPYLGAAMIAYGLISCLRKSIFCRRVIRSFFKAIDEPPKITVIMNEDGIDIQSKHSNGRIDWAGLVDYRRNDHGVLLYPKEGTFYWIPAHCAVDRGNWDSVLECVQTNLKRKV